MQNISDDMLRTELQTVKRKKKKKRHTEVRTYAFVLGSWDFQVSSQCANWNAPRSQISDLESQGSFPSLNTKWWHHV